jgi:hypothetical protein
VSDDPSEDDRAAAGASSARPLRYRTERRRRQIAVWGAVVLILALLGGALAIRLLGSNKETSPRASVKSTVMTTITGTYTFSRQATVCAGFASGCSLKPLVVRIDCPAASSCTFAAKTTAGAWGPSHALAFSGTEMRGSGPDSVGASCAGVSRPATISLHLTVDSWIVRGSRRRPRSIHGTFADNALAVSGFSAACPAAHFIEILTSQ